MTYSLDGMGCQILILVRRFVKRYSDGGSCPNLGERSEGSLIFAFQEVGASAPTYGPVCDGLLSPEASGAEAPRYGNVNVGAEAPTS